MELKLLSIILGILIVFIISFIIFIVDYAEFKSKVQDIIYLDAKINNTAEKVLLHTKDIIDDNYKIINFTGRIVGFNDKIVRHFVVKSDEENNDE